MPIDADRRLDRVTRRQFSVFTLTQGLELGVPKSTIYRRVHCGEYENPYPEVFRVAAAPDSREARWLAAVLGVGGDAVLSHTSALAHLGLLDTTPDRIHISTAEERKWSRPTVRLHHTPWLTDEDVSMRSGIPVMDCAVALLQAAATMPPRTLRKCVNEALRRSMVTPAELARVLRRFAGARGVARLRRVVTELSPGIERSRTEIEALYLDLTVGAGLPPATMNHPVVDAHGERRFIDAAYVPQKVPVELDSGDFHRTAIDLADDRRRQNALVLAGWNNMLRFTWWDLLNEPERVVAEVRAVLARAEAARDAPSV